MRVLSRQVGHTGFVLECGSDPLQEGQLAGLPVDSNCNEILRVIYLLLFI